MARPRNEENDLLLRHDLKRCADCGTLKETSDFPKSNVYPFFHMRCKSCYNTYSRGRYKHKILSKYD